MLDLQAATGLTYGDYTVLSGYGTEQLSNSTMAKLIYSVPIGFDSYIAINDNVRNNPGALVVTLAQAVGNQLTWSGAANNGLWDDSISLNWVRNGTVTPTFYRVGWSDDARFGDLPASAQTITLDQGVSPNTLYFENSTATTYTFLGTSGFSATGLSLIKTGNGMVTLATDNTYGGFTKIQAGILQVGNGGVGGYLGSPLIVNDGTLIYNKGADFDHVNVILGKGELIKTGTGKMSMVDSQNFYTGGTKVLAGTLRTEGSTFLPSDGSIGVIGGTLDLNSNVTQTLTSVTVSNSGRLVVGDLAQVRIGNLAVQSGTANVGTQLVFSQLIIGDAGLNTSGVVISRSDAFLGSAAGSTGTATISGVGSRWSVSSGLYLGGTINSAGGSGSLSLTNGGALIVGGTLKLWNNGTLTIDGGSITARSLDRTLGNFDLKNGTITLSGGHYSHNSGTNTTENILTLNGNDVGAPPTLQLNLGTTATGVEATVVGADHNGMLIISGGSVLTNTGAGTLLGTIGGTNVNRGDGALGLLATGSGTATVTGSGSKWSVQNLLSVGVSGTGVLNVNSGGKITSSSAVLAANSGSVGTAIISGTGSQWTITGGLSVGGTGSAAGGTGSLQITDGGNVIVGGTTKVWQNGEIVVTSGGTFAGTLQSEGEATVNGTQTGNVVVLTGGVLNGAGVVAGMVSGAGTLSPGNSPGILDVVQIDPASGLDFLFEFSLVNALPNFLNRTASGNDLLHLTHGSTPFLQSLTSNNVITIDFQVGSLIAGNLFYGGFFTEQAGVDFFGNGTIENADFQFTLNGGSLPGNGWMFNVSTTDQVADFGPGYGGSVNGRIMTVTVQAVPEPGSIVLCGVAAVGFYLRRRRNRNESGTTESVREA